MSIQELIEKYRSIVVQIATADGSGTGFLLPRHQLIVTNHHVIKGNWTATLKGKHLEKQLGTVVYTNPRWDLAFIRLEQEIALEVDLLGENLILQDGEAVIAIGHPFGLDYTATQGVVSRLERVQNGLTYIQTDTAINPGNSGGPLINLQGQIVGVNTFIIQNADNLGFALPVQYVKDAVASYLPYYGKQIACCASCSGLVGVENVDMEKYCPECGTEVQLPTVDQNDTHVAGGMAATVESALELLGIPKNLCRNGAHAWAIDQGSANINIIYKPEKYAVFLDASMGRLPKQNIKPLYEYMLRENCNKETHFFFTVQENIYLSAVILNMDISPQECAGIFTDIFTKADDYDDILMKRFGCLPPVYEDR
jgi:serine protease Do